MDPRLYKAARDGNVDVLTQYKDQLDVQLTPNNNTVLHVAAQSHNESTCVKEILEMQSSLLCRMNSKGETPLHIAAREGHHNVVQALIQCAKARDEELESGVGAAKEMLRMTNEGKNTALHEAVRNNHFTVVRFLTQADPSEFLHLANKAEETPLYLAAERGYHDLVSEILENCTSPAVGGPGARTALHAAVISDLEGITTKLLHWNPELIKEKDAYGWTPLHCAAHFGYDSRVKQLIEFDKSVAYLTAEGDEKKTALHVAASQGHLNVMEALMDYCPDCWEMANSRGQNILHIAVETEKRKVIEFILKNSLLISSLINQEDADGNTPLHLCNVSNMFVPDLLLHPKADMMAFNKENSTPLDAVTYTDTFITRVYKKIVLKRVGATLSRRNIISKDNNKMTRRKERTPIEMVKKKGEIQLIVATLIATVTYAAGFTVPGGYDGNDGPNHGMAILAREAAFKAFIITDTIAMLFSIIAVFLYLISSLYEDRAKVVHRYEVAFYLILIAQGAMVVAFITGIYAVLGHSLGLVFAVCVIGGLFFLIYYFALKRLYVEIR